MNGLGLRAAGAGIALVWSTQWWVMHGAGVTSAWAAANPLWYGAIIEVALGISLVLPGLCTGWIARRHGIRLGALIGLLGGITYSVGFPMLHMRPNPWHFLSTGPLWIAVAGPAFLLMLTCAGGGAAGELLRSNNRSRGP